MKKFIVFLLILILIILSTYFVKNNNKEIPEEKHIEEYTSSDLVSYNGWLNVDGIDIKNEKGEKVQLVGVSTHGIQWYAEHITKKNIQTLKNEWGVNTIRIAVYTEVDGELVYNTQMNDQIMELIDLVVDEDMYVILDWHVLAERNPNKYEDEAIEFFDTFSKKYADTPNVIYEICNEPNGGTVEWSKHIKPYAEEVIKEIRKNSEKSLIIVGTPSWSKDFSEVKDDLLQYDNILYAYHFYAGAEDTKISDLEDIIENKIPVIVSEWGITDSTGNGEIYIENANKWVEILNENNISWIMWSFSNKNESTAMLKPTYYNSRNLNEYLTEAGEYTKEIIMKTKDKEIQEEISEEQQNDV